MKNAANAALVIAMTVILATMLASLLDGCAGSHPGPEPDAAPAWLPVDCTEVERVVWESTTGERHRRTTVTSRVMLVEADAAHVVVRVPSSPWPVEPCSETPVESCDVHDQVALSPDGVFRYRGPWDATVTGLDSGEARVVCDTEVLIETWGPGGDDAHGSSVRSAFAEGGEYRVR